MVKILDLNSFREKRKEENKKKELKRLELKIKKDKEESKN